MYFNIKTWLQAHPKVGGLVVVVEGAVGGAIGSLVDDYLRGQVTFDKAGLHKMAAFVVGFVLVAVRNWLKQPPATPDAK